MKNCITIAFMLFCLYSLSGCTKSVDGIDFPFQAADIENVEVYHYESVPETAEKKIVTEHSDIKELYNVFSSITLEEKSVEEVAGAPVTIFQFNLPDNQNYVITYVGIAVKSGIVKSSAGGFTYYTTADVGKCWDNLPYEATKVIS